MNAPRFLLPYLVGTTSYGAARKVIQLWDAKVTRYSREQRDFTVQPMLMGSKLMAFGAAVFYAPLLSPFWIIKDLDYIDARLRNDESMVEYLSEQPFTMFEHIVS
jgi:hypothetical protein